MNRDNPDDAPALTEFFSAVVASSTAFAALFTAFAAFTAQASNPIWAQFQVLSMPLSAIGLLLLGLAAVISLVVILTHRARRSALGLLARGRRLLLALCGVVTSLAVVALLLIGFNQAGSLPTIYAYSSASEKNLPSGLLDAQVDGKPISFFLTPKEIGRRPQIEGHLANVEGQIDLYVVRPPDIIHWTVMPDKATEKFTTTVPLELAPGGYSLHFNGPLVGTFEVS